MFLGNGSVRLFDANLCAWVSTAGKCGLFDSLEADDAVFCSVDGEVTADVRTFASDLRAAGLADEDFTCRDFLATKALHAEACAGVVVDVLA